MNSKITNIGLEHIKKSDMASIASNKKFKIKLDVDQNGVNISKVIKVSEQVNKSVFVNTNADEGTVFDIDVGKQLRDAGNFNGLYNIKYKFYLEEPEDYVILDISKNRTEIKFKAKDLLTINSNYDSQFVVFGDKEYLIVNYKTFGGFHYFKLISPLTQKANIGDKFKLIEKIFNDYEDNVSLITNKDLTKGGLNILKAPETAQYISQLNKTQTYNWNELVNITEDNIYEFIKSKVDSSPEGIELKVDYRKFDYFIKYSSAVARLESFKNKLKSLEALETKRTNIQAVSGSINSIYESSVLSNIIELKSTFDGFERYMYYESGSAWTDSNDELVMSLTSPKTNSTYPYTLASTSSVAFKTWYTSAYEWAKEYDEGNKHSFLNVLPFLMRLDNNNIEFAKFIVLIGHYFDVINIYIKHITELKNLNYSHTSGTPFGLLLEMLNNYGFKIKSSYAIKTLKQYMYETES